MQTQRTTGAVTCVWRPLCLSAASNAQERSGRATPEATHERAATHETGLRCVLHRYNRRVSPDRMVSSVSLAVVVPVVLALCGVAVLLIVVGPSRRIRAERRLDPDTEAALLLGEDPDDLSSDDESRESLRDSRRHR